MQFITRDVDAFPGIKGILPLMMMYYHVYHVNNVPITCSPVPGGRGGLCAVCYLANRWIRSALSCHSGEDPSGTVKHHMVKGDTWTFTHTVSLTRGNYGGGVGVAKGAVLMGVGVGWGCTWGAGTKKIGWADVSIELTAGGGGAPARSL